MYIDRIDLVLPESDLTSVLAALTSASGTLEPLPSVSTADRKRYAKLGMKNEALALQIIEVGRANPDLIPRGIDFEKIDRDLVAREQLRSLKLLLEALLGRVNDSMLLTGVDIYAAALSIYHCLRRNADTTSLKETVDELKKGFARPSRKKKQQEETAPASVGMSPQPQATNPVAKSTSAAPEEPTGRSISTDKAPAPSTPHLRHTGVTTTFLFSPHRQSQTRSGWLPISAIPTSSEWSTAFCIPAVPQATGQETFRMLS